MPGIAAVIFDVDGTLYDTQRMRNALALRLGVEALRRPRAALQAVRIVRAYRLAHERLRGRHHENLADAQLALTASLCAVDESSVRRVIETWFEQLPLTAVASAARPGLRAGLDRLRDAGIRTAVLSDYPPVAKLHAMGITASFDHVAWAQQPAVGVLKPDPSGLRVVLRTLGVAPAQAVYVGDRYEVDVEAARAAGCGAALVGRGGGEVRGVARHPSIGALVDWMLRGGDDGGRAAGSVARDASRARM